MGLIGMVTDDVIKKYGKPMGAEVLGEESELAQEVALPTGETAHIAALIVLWRYPTFEVELRHREGMYRVVRKGKAGGS